MQYRKTLCKKTGPYREFLVRQFSIQQNLPIYFPEQLPPLYMHEMPFLSAPDGFDISEHVNTTFRMFDCVHEEVELICDNDVMDAIIDRFGEDVNVFPNDQNAFRAVVIVATSNVFYSWIFGFGGKVKIQNPVYVKEQYAEMLRSAVTSL